MCEQELQWLVALDYIKVKAVVRSNKPDGSSVRLFDCKDLYGFQTSKSKLRCPSPR